MTPDNQTSAALAPEIEKACFDGVYGDGPFELAKAYRALLASRSQQGAVAWPAGCCVCGWVGKSTDAAGGDPIADTGDFSDPVCPECVKNDGPWIPVVDLETFFREHRAALPAPATHSSADYLTFETGETSAPAPALPAEPTACCIGRSDGAKGCGYESNATEVCPKCGGMVLTFKSQLEASRLAYNLLSGLYEAAIKAPALPVGWYCTRCGDEFTEDPGLGHGRAVPAADGFGSEQEHCGPIEPVAPALSEGLTEAVNNLLSLLDDYQGIRVDLRLANEKQVRDFAGFAASKWNAIIDQCAEVRRLSHAQTKGQE